MKRILFILILSLSNVVFGQQPVTDLGFVAASGFDYLIVGGGGAGGYGNSNEGGGGGGAGGYLTGSISSNSQVTYTVSVGAGGNGVNSTNSPGGNGGSSSIAGQGITTITALGGGGGGGCGTSGSNGSSGGGGSGCGTDRPGGSGTAGQGNNGGTGRWINNSPGNGNGGGGGGSSSAGGNGITRNRRTKGGGGAGTSNDITGTTIVYASGGDGGPGGTGGNYNPPDTTGNTGNGGIGGTNHMGGDAANGIVLLRYIGTPVATGGTIIQNSGYTIHSFIQVGNTSFVFQGGSSTSTVSVDEEVAVGTVVRSLVATDADSTTHTFTLVSGNGDAHNGLFSISGTNLLVNGFIDYEQTPSLSIRLEATDGQSTYSKALTVEVNDINEPPVIVSTELATDNSVVSVTFSEVVFNSNGGSGALQANDFSLTLTGGTASLSGSTPSSISNQGNTYGLGIPVTGNINGSEVLKVLPATNSIYDAGAATASTTQTSNTINLNGDADGDGVNDPVDLCPDTPQGAQVDADGCADSQKDPDNDGITGLNDNCPTTANPGQEDTDGDGIGDACDPDIDADGIANESDNCPSIYNPNQVDTDADNIGNLCDTDIDGDGYLNWNDAFPFDPNEWLDTDRDGIGNNADPDDDGDGYEDTEDAFPLDPKEWLDTDADGIGNNADPDDDGDGYPDTEDALPLDPTEWLDTDEDGIGNNADLDDDGDGYLDEDEIACDSDPLDFISRPKDFDRDMLPDCTDPDDDNDGCPDTEDAFPLDPRECKDTDGDGIGDNADWDSDNDGIPDSKDAFPFDPTEWLDTDGDGIGDNKDTDKNNDGFPDDQVFVSGVLTPGSTGLEGTWKVINIGEDNFTIVTVYSPDGAVVFKKTNYKNDWRGTHYKTGRPLPTGPYLYEVYFGKGQKPVKGWLYIFN